MAAARKCDICGKFYEPYNNMYIDYSCRKNPDHTNGFTLLNIVNDGDFATTNIQDCCPECMESIKRYIESLKS